MGGRVDCKKIPAAFTKWNATKAVDTCDYVHVYRHRNKPLHELIRLEREKEEKDAKEREHLVKHVLRICEWEDEIFRFLAVAFGINITEDQPVYEPPKKKKKKNKKKN